MSSKTCGGRPKNSRQPATITAFAASICPSLNCWNVRSATCSNDRLTSKRQNKIRHPLPFRPAALGVKLAAIRLAVAPVQKRNARAAPPSRLGHDVFQQPGADALARILGADEQLRHVPLAAAKK